MFLIIWKLIAFRQKYSAKVSSVLPVLMSAKIVSPPSDGPPHAGKELGKDVVTYTFSQVNLCYLLLYPSR